MMSVFSCDADLLAIEPGVFVDLGSLARGGVRIDDAVLNGTQVSSVSGGFDDLAGGDVVVIGHSAAEMAPAAVASVTDDHQLELASAPNTIGDGEGLAMVQRSFASQRSMVHDQIMQLLQDDLLDPSIDETMVLSDNVLVQLESLGTLWWLYAGASAIAGDNEGVIARARAYEQRYKAALRAAVIRIDTNGDGAINAVVRPGVGRLTRG
jgi:hypothetical protein